MTGGTCSCNGSIFSPDRCVDLTVFVNTGRVINSMSTVIGVVGMAGVNSLLHNYTSGASAEMGSLINEIIANINVIDTFLLTMAMTALGMGTRFAKFKGLGMAPLYTAGTMFLWLLIGGYFITTWVIATF